MAAELQTWLGVQAGIRIVSSPRLRAIQTAAQIALVLAASVEVDERWAETDFGLAEGLTFDELGVAAPDIAGRLAAGDVEIDWPGGETAAALVARIDAAWRDVVSATDGLLVVTHGGPIRVAIARATGCSPADVVVPDPAGVVHLSGNDSRTSWSIQEPG
jgi:broad specificity phosphatase PhoE